MIFIAVVARRPADFCITRSARISALPAGVFPQVNDLHQFQAWSPWAKLDPNAKIIYSGPTAGVGASFSWAGNKQLGEGRMSVTESRPDSLVRCRLEFIKPFAATNTAEFTFKLEGGQTVVTWSMTGKNNFMCKAVGLFMNMDNMVGGPFEKGLASLKLLVEGK